MDDLLKSISRGETESSEFKESLRLKEEIGQAVSAFSNAYKRVGKTNQMISSSELRKLAKESGGRVYWDELVYEEAKLEDIDGEKVRRFLRRARYGRRLEISPDISVREALERLNSIKNKIVKWCLEHGLREPDFEEIAGGFLVRFYAPEDILSLIPEPGKIDLDKLGLNERQIKALGLMVNEGKVFTNKEYREHFGVSNWTCVDDMKLLEKHCFVIVEGKEKSTVYRASESPHEKTHGGRKKW